MRCRGPRGPAVRPPAPGARHRRRRRESRRAVRARPRCRVPPAALPSGMRTGFFDRRLGREQPREASLAAMCEGLDANFVSRPCASSSRFKGGRGPDQAIERGYIVGVRLQGAGEVFVGRPVRVGAQEHQSAIAPFQLRWRRRWRPSTAAGFGLAAANCAHAGGVVVAREPEDAAGPGELQARSVVGLQLGAGGPRRERGALRDEQRRHREGLLDPDRRQVGGHARSFPGGGHARRCDRPGARSDPISSTSASPTSHSVPSGNTERNVATIDRRSSLLMS